MYNDAEDLVMLAKRENNTKRGYLYVNPYQAKHIPSDPIEMIKMCRSLAALINTAHSTDRTFVIGFAETATGIAAGVTENLKNAVYFQDTTRERYPGKGFIFFTESHSHATEQKLIKNDDMAKRLKRIDRIIFIDDEVTTGNTICKLIAELKKVYKMPKMKFTIASVLNSMTAERITELQNRGIDCIYLKRLPFEYKADTVESIETDTDLCIKVRSNIKYGNRIHYFYTGADQRLMLLPQVYRQACDTCAARMISLIPEKKYRNILIVGTEEFMFPAISAGVMIETFTGIPVKVQATTRSPIVPSEKKGYPLNKRYELRSIYEDTRKTFIYNVEAYDKVFIMTDTEPSYGADDIISTLQMTGNKDITLIRWMYHEKGKGNDRRT